jgi:hypothetical protein
MEIPTFRRTAMAGAAAVVCAALLAACGGNPATGVANLGQKTTSTQPQGGVATTAPSAAQVQANFNKALKYSECMRAHGEPKFPDPDSTGGLKITSSSGIDPASPQFQAAQKECQKYSPFPHPSQAQIAKQERQVLAFAACLRKNGVPNYPDPTFGPEGQVDGAEGQVDEKPGSDVDRNSPSFQAAVKKCNR